MSQPLNLVDLVPGAHLGHYVIVDKIAHGGMGTVFKALEPALERYVAIKVLRPEYATNLTYVQYFQEEARAVAALRHPNIIPIFFIGQEGNVVFFSMSYIEGETFDDWIETKRWFDEEHARWFLSYAIAALHSAHKANIVHLDIKPANFLVDRANNIMLTDFGLAEKIVKSAGEGGTRETFGTPAYVAPEQITRETTDQRTDIYSLGATLFHLMTGQQPFSGNTVEDIIWGHLEKPFPMEIAVAANMPTGWIHLIRKMMERSPDKRFNDYRELRTALENIHTFRYETAVIETVTVAKPISIPRSGNNAATLHGLMAQGKAQWVGGQAAAGSSIQISRKQVEEAKTSRLDPLKVQSLANVMRDLSRSSRDDPEALAEVMEKVPGYDPAVRALVNFMVNPETEEEAAENMKPTDALETLGIDRAHNLALTFFALNYECPQWPNFEWTPLWRHQIAVAVVMDFFYDALDLKRSGLEYVAGTFHDIGKLILADLFPFAYFTVLNRALSEEMSLAACETAMFGITHAELGANWMKEQEFPQALVDAVARHEMPELLGRRSLLGNALVSANQLVKQIGIGYSGNPALDPNPWPELASTKAMWDSRGSRKYAFDDFTQDILNQFQNFPDLL